MRGATAFLVFILLIACRGQQVEDARRSQQPETKDAPAAGWTIDETMKVRNVDKIRISPDGRRVLFTVRTAVLSGDKGAYLHQIWSADADGANQRPLTDGEYSATDAEWSPDGRWIAFLSDRSGSSEGPTIWLIPATGGAPQSIDAGGTGVTNIKWSPEGTNLAFTMPVPATPAQVEAGQHASAPQVVDVNIRSMQLWVIGIAQDGTPHGPARALTSDSVSVRTDTEFGNPFDWSPDGSAISFAYSRDLDWWNNWPSTGISMVDIAGGETKPLVTAGAMAPSYSPDGQWIAYLATAGRYAPHNLDIFIASSAGGQPRKLAKTFDRHPTLIGWSGDGTRLYVSEARGTITRLSALPVAGAPGLDIDPGDAVLGAFTLQPSRTMLGFTRQTLTQPVEAYITRLDEFRPVQVSQANAALAAHPLPDTEVVRWRSSDGEVEGLLTYPMDYEPGKRYPLVVAVHAGGQAFQQVFGANPFPLQTPLIDTYPVTELAERGYAILRCNCRGGLLPGYGPAYAVPWNRAKDKAYADVMSGVDRVIELGIADSSRLGITGFSNGGMVVSWVIAQTARFKAAIVYAGLPDLIAEATMFPWISYDLGAEPWENIRPYAEHSPLLRLGGVKTPTLILHGERDEQVPITQGYGLYRALKRRGVPTEMVVYPGEGHVVSAPKHLIDIAKRHVEWMDRFLLR